MLLEACLNGPGQRGGHAALPLTPEEIAADAALVSAAGAGAVAGLPVGVTTGAWALPDPVEAGLWHAVRRGPAARIGLEGVLEPPDGTPSPDSAPLVRTATRVLRGRPVGPPG